MLGYYENFPKNIHAIARFQYQNSTKSLQQAILYVFHRLNHETFDLDAVTPYLKQKSEVSFEFGARDLDVGGMFERLGIAKDLKASAGLAAFQVTSRGSTLAEVIAGSELMARIEGASWTLTDAASGSELPLLLDRAELRSGGGEPIRFTAAGSVEGNPLGLEISTTQRSFFRDLPERVPLLLRAEAAGATLEVETSVALPIRKQRFEGTLSLSGERLDRLASLLHYQLPPIGPYRLGARARVTPSAYLLSDLDLRVANSRLKGKGSLHPGGARPRIDIDQGGDEFGHHRGACPLAGRLAGQVIIHGQHGELHDAQKENDDEREEEGEFDNRHAVLIAQATSPSGPRPDKAINSFQP